MNWDSEIENLKDLVFNKKLSYEKIGALYKCTGNNIKKVLKRRGIILPLRSKYHGKVHINEDKRKKIFCLNCGKDITNAQNRFHKFCSNKCQHDYSYKQWVEKYKKDNSFAKNNKWGSLPKQLRRYIFEKFENKCSICGWSEINPFTKTLPLEIDHIDGNSDNNSEENLTLLCPNHHSLTKTYRGANRGNGRKITWIIKPPKL